MALCISNNAFNIQLGTRVPLSLHCQKLKLIFLIFLQFAISIPSPPQKKKIKKKKEPTKHVSMKIIINKWEMRFTDYCQVHNLSVYNWDLLLVLAVDLTDQMIHEAPDWLDALDPKPGGFPVDITIGPDRACPLHFTLTELLQLRVLQWGIT